MFIYFFEDAVLSLLLNILFKKKHTHTCDQAHRG